jgi:two-component system response regulator TctD
MRILLAEDDHGLGEWLRRALEQAGHRVDWRDDGRLAERALAEADHDVLVLDLGLPGLGGHELVQRLRARGSPLPVLVLTARDSLAERVSALHEGADDFLAKPFALAELEARLTALVRRARGLDRPRLACGRLQFDPMSRRDLAERVFSDDDDVQPAALDVLMHRLRRRLEGSGVHIQTYRGLGYALEPSVLDPVALAPAALAPEPVRPTR